jgi:hypothetical protein
MHRYLAAYQAHKENAERAYALFLAHYPKAPRVPGCDTVIRLAWRIECGRTPEEAAAREYVYRWHLAVKPFDQCAHGIVNPVCSVFGTPHTIGM